MERIFYFFVLLSVITTPSCKTDYPGQEATAADPNAPVPVRTVELQPSTAALPIEAGGTIGSKTEARLSFKIGGIIDRMNAREGQYVRRGATLAQLKTTEIDAQVQKVTQGRDKIRRDLDRLERLYADSAATLDNVEALRTALAVANSDLEIAQFNRDYAKITAPVSGRIVKKLAETGELVGPGTPIYFLTGEGQNAYVLRVGVADRDVLHLQLGDPAEVSLDAYQGATVPARVTEIAAAADPMTGTFEVELTLEPGDKTLRPGFIGRARILPSRRPEHIRLPLDALVEGAGREAIIFYPKDGKATARTVRVLRLLDREFVVATDQLSGIDRVITEGAAYLSEGSLLHIQ